jgi:hypothetical protein
MCIQIVAIEGTDVSPVKVGMMAFAPIIFILKTPCISKALFWGFLYWAICYLIASYQDYMRFSTVGYFGLFIISYIVYYNLVYIGAFSLNYFTKLLQRFIIAYAIMLILQQLAILVGIHSFALINLTNQDFLSLTKLPSLSLEPSHSARFLTVMMLSYLRCVEIVDGGSRPTIKTMFSKKYRRVSIFFLWAMLTMGSGTAFVGLGLLSFYFIQRRTVIYIIPLLIALFYIGQIVGLTQMDRAVRVIQATTTGNVKVVQTEDGSAALRIIPLINTFTRTDLTKSESWFGKGTLTYEYTKSRWKRITGKIAIVEQYGLLGLITSLLLVYTCMIHRFFSLETFIFLFLFGLSLGNIAYGWGAMMIFTAVRYFQIQNEKGVLIINNNNNEY